MFGTNGSEKVRIDVNGNVGINTTNSTAKLEISGFSTGAGLKLNYGNSSGTIEAVNFIANGGANGVIGMQMVSAGVGDLWLGGSGGRTLTLYRDGNVGIGTDSPNQKLQVVGAIAQTIGSATTTHFVGVTGSLTTNTVVASLDVSTQPAYGVFFDYVVYDDTEPPANARAGNIMTVNNNSTSRYTDTSTSDIGDTTPVDFSTSISGNNLLLTANIASGTWYVRLNYRRF
jgi:hypothetical protein